MRTAAVLVTALLLAGCTDSPEPGLPTFAYGQMADVQVDVDGTRVPLQATVRVVERGSRQVLEDAGLAVPDTPGKEPYYVRVGYSNTTGRAFAAPVEQQFRPREGDGRYAVRLDVIGGGQVGPCTDPVPPPTFGTLGGAAEACLIVMVDEGTTITSVEWAFADRAILAVWKPIP